MAAWRGQAFRHQLLAFRSRNPERYHHQDTETSGKEHKLIQAPDSQLLTSSSSALPPKFFSSPPHHPPITKMKEF
jgi:hypothetical protein